MSESDSLLPLREALEGLIAKWRAEGARIDTFHATMGTGWKVCADNLRLTLLDSEVSPSLEGRWQAIATAPKDQLILLFDDGAYILGLWDEETQAWFDHGPMEPPPTHWLPLPPAPRPSAEPDEEKATDVLTRIDTRDSALVQPPQPPTGEK